MEESVDTTGSKSSPPFGDDFCLLSSTSLGVSFDILHSQYAKVVFHDLRDTYPTDADLRCRYTVSSDVPTVHGDRVVLYKVGWTSVHEYLMFEWAQMPNSENREMEVSFKANMLPKDENEFYQLCYLSMDGKVYGASTPLQFRHPHEGDLCEVEDEESGITVIRSRAAVVEEELWQAQRNCEDLTASVVDLEKKNNELSRELKRKDLTITDLEGKAAAIEVGIKELANGCDPLLPLMETVKVIVEEREEGRRKQTKLSGELVATKEQLFASKRDNEAVKTELARLKEMMRQEREKLRVELEAAQREWEKLETQLKNTTQELKELQENSEELVIVQSIYKELRVIREDLLSSEARPQDVEKRLLQAKMQGLMQLLEESTRAISKLYTSKKLAPGTQENCPLSRHVVQLHRYLNQSSREYQELLRNNSKLQRKIEKLEEKLHEIAGGMNPESGSSSIPEENSPCVSGASSLSSKADSRQVYRGIVEMLDKQIGMLQREKTVLEMERLKIEQGESGTAGASTIPFATPILASSIPTNLPPPLTPQVVPQSVRSEGIPVEQPCLQCPICDETFESPDVELVNRHMDSHLDLSCPMCSATFSRDKQDDLEMHVNRHFGDNPSIQGWDFAID